MPTTVTVDGALFDFTVMRGNDCYSIFLPNGIHKVNIVTGDKFAYGINITSFWSTTAIAVFGAFAISLLLVMYVFLKFIRRSPETRKA
jgi:ABC-type antimicrobial peptide transport system permease subunit